MSNQVHKIVKALEEKSIYTRNGYFVIHKDNYFFDSVYAQMTQKRAYQGKPKHEILVSEEGTTTVAQSASFKVANVLNVKFMKYTREAIELDWLATKPERNILFILKNYLMSLFDKDYPFPTTFATGRTDTINLSQKRVGDLLQTDRKTVRQGINSLIEKNVIHPRREVQGDYFINPLFFHTGIVIPEYENE